MARRPIDRLALDPLDARMLALALYHKLDGRVVQLFVALMGEQIAAARGAARPTPQS